MIKQITSSLTILIKLRIILQEDIQTLSKMLNKRSPESKSYKLIHSLLRLKESILAQIPENLKGIYSNPTTGQRKRLTSYNKEGLIDYNDETFISKTFYSVEKEQYSLVKDALQGKIFPDEVNKIMISVLSIYQKILAQLERNQKNKSYKCYKIGPNNTLY